MGVSAAFEIVARNPLLWLYGSLGFTLRGGIVALALPIVVLPTQVEARALLGGNLGSNGLTDGFWWLLALGALLGVAFAIGIAALLARLELASFERVAGPLRSRAAARGAYRQLIGVQVLAMVGLAVAAIPLAMAVGQIAYDELLRPTSTASIYVRVLARVGPQIFVLLVGLVAVELVSALASRDILARAALTGSPGNTIRSFGRSLVGALVRPLRSPARTLATAAFGWALTGFALLAAGWLIALAWQSVRARFLTSVAFGNLGADAGADLQMFVIATGLAAAFVAGILGAGLASAVRGAAWSVERLS
jgi:hypothetical protein